MKYYSAAASYVSCNSGGPNSATGLVVTVLKFHSYNCVQCGVLCNSDKFDLSLMKLFYSPKKRNRNKHTLFKLRLSVPLQASKYNFFYELQNNRIRKHTENECILHSRSSSTHIIRRIMKERTMIQRPLYL